MKIAGIVIICIGLLMTVYTGFSYFTKDNVVKVGDLALTKDTEHNINWQPYVGIGTMILGGAVVLFSRKKQ